MNQLREFEAWFEDFKVSRIIAKTAQRIDGRPLYCYQLNEEEFFQLRSLFSTYYRGLTRQNLTLNMYYGAAFVMLGSEFYRTISQRQWSWRALECFIGVYYGVGKERFVLIELGFEFWKLSMSDLKQNRNGRDYLGAVLCQGGLPWMLLQKQGDPLASLLHHLFMNYYQLMSRDGTLKFEMATYVSNNHIPKYQQTSHTLELIIRVVKSTVYLKRTYKHLHAVENIIEFIADNKVLIEDIILTMDSHQLKTQLLQDG